MSDTIKWSELTPDRRNQLVHEKIFSLQPEPCQQSDDDEITLSCSACGHHYSNSLVEWTDPQEVPYIPYRQNAHTRPIPSYTTSLDAAWLVLQEMVKRHQQNEGKYINPQFEMFADLILKGGEWDSSSAFSEIYPACEIFVIASQWTPEMICLTALRACDVEVEA